jgi:CO/xanthine dehydrogenase FAD-binding subunit
MEACRGRRSAPCLNERIVSSYLRPATLQEALESLAHSPGVILSGGTDFFPARVDRPLDERVIDISGVRELRGISVESDRIVIGGRTTWTEIIASPLPRGFDGLKAAAREVGSVQIQNFGTVAGNLCNASPAADGVPPLLALDAEVTLSSIAGSRVLPLSEFILGNRKTARRPDEILTAVAIPRRLENAASRFAKLGARRYLVISIVMVAVTLLSDERGVISEARVAVGSCSAQARRLLTLEQALVGIPAKAGIGEIIAREHLNALSPIDDVRGTAAYRNDASLAVIRRTLESCVEAR